MRLSHPSPCSLWQTWCLQSSGRGWWRPAGSFFDPIFHRRETWRAVTIHGHNDLVTLITSTSAVSCLTSIYCMPTCTPNYLPAAAPLLFPSLPTSTRLKHFLPLQLQQPPWLRIILMKCN